MQVKKKLGFEQCVEETSPVVVGSAEEVEVPGLSDQAVGAAHRAGKRVAHFWVQNKLPLVQPAHLHTHHQCFASRSAFFFRNAVRIQMQGFNKTFNEFTRVRPVLCYILQ
jgi:hypothetical protein